MKKKILIIIVSGILLFSMQVTAHQQPVSTNETKEGNPSIINRQGDELDQYQLNQSYGLLIGSFNANEPQWKATAAQEFTPTKSILTRVELYIKNNDALASEPYVVSIRETLEGPDLTVASLSPTDIGDEYTWIEFDFDDITVTPGEIYYIFSQSENVQDNKYQWGWYHENVYPNGTCYSRINENSPYDDLLTDLTFKTYGIDTTALAISFENSVTSFAVIIENSGDVDAHDVVVNIEASGGIFGLIDASVSSGYDEISIGSNEVITLPQLIGLGPLSISVTVESSNADELSDNWDGLIVLFFILG